MLSLKPPDSFDRNSNITLLNAEVAGLSLPQSVALFGVLCDFGGLKLSDGLTTVAR